MKQHTLFTFESLFVGILKPNSGPLKFLLIILQDEIEDSLDNGDGAMYTSFVFLVLPYKQHNIRNL